MQQALPRIVRVTKIWALPIVAKESSVGTPLAKRGCVPARFLRCIAEFCEETWNVVDRVNPDRVPILRDIWAVQWGAGRSGTVVKQVVTKPNTRINQ
jgi:hypothetical protein